jgi:hypothetical protein
VIYIARAGITGGSKVKKRAPMARFLEENLKILSHFLIERVVRAPCNDTRKHHPARDSVPRSPSLKSFI